MTEEQQQNWIANFWRRIGALVLDTLLLGLVGFLLGLALENFFVQIGGWGRFVGFIIALIYFGVMNSKICEGQTIGKRILDLRVVDSGGQTIPFSKSVIRTTIYTVPFSLNGANLSDGALTSFSIYPLSMIVFGGCLSIVYLYIFNRVTRQSLHDLSVGTFVVNANSEKQEVGTPWKLHLGIVVFFFIAAAVAPVITGHLVNKEPFNDMLAVQTAIMKETSVNYATVTATSSTYKVSNEESKNTSYVTVQAFLLSNTVKDAELARELATITIQNYPGARNKAALRITLTYGYDIGIWSNWTYQSHDFNPLEISVAD